MAVRHQETPSVFLPLFEAKRSSGTCVSLKLRRKVRFFRNRKRALAPLIVILKAWTTYIFNMAFFFLQNGDLVHRKEYQHWIQQEDMDVSDIVQNWPCLRGKINGLGIPWRPWMTHRSVVLQDGDVGNPYSTQWVVHMMCPKYVGKREVNGLMYVGAVTYLPTNIVFTNQTSFWSIESV